MQLTGTRKAAAWGITFGLTALALPTARLEAQGMLGETSYLPQQLDMALGLEAMTGESSYAIGGDIALADGQTLRTIFPMSELEWPLDTWLTRLDAGWTFNPYWRINGTLKTNLSDPDDHMTDKDWLTESRPSQLDVYSESSISSLDAVIFDIDLEWTFWQEGLWNFYAGLGYQHQNFQYEGSLLQQFSPSGLLGYNYKGKGSLDLTYDLTCSMPYLLLGSEYQLTPQLKMSGNVSLAPLAALEDETVLLLRSKMASGDMDGVAYLADLSGIYYFTPWWFMKAGLHYAGIEADGEQHQTLQGQALGEIDMELESSQASGYVNVGYSF